MLATFNKITCFINECINFIKSIIIKYSWEFILKYFHAFIYDELNGCH